MKTTDRTRKRPEKEREPPHTSAVTSRHCTTHHCSAAVPPPSSSRINHPPYLHSNHLPAVATRWPETTRLDLASLSIGYVCVYCEIKLMGARVLKKMKKMPI
ncbi:hypothetical protein HanRHA438_Chr17g0824931 [Helianthus annuus]|nr:hypothetical protein HanRHA438_Chr17g0824931 [Helianthus annuus]